MITELQRLELEMLRHVEFNEFYGARVADDLLQCRDMWRAVVADRSAFSTAVPVERVINLIKLRDLPSGYWNVDTIFILTDRYHVERLEARIAERWQASVIEVVGTKEAEYWMECDLHPDTRLLRVWSD